MPNTSLASLRLLWFCLFSCSSFYVVLIRGGSSSLVKRRLDTQSWWNTSYLYCQIYNHLLFKNERTTPTLPNADFKPQNYSTDLLLPLLQLFVFLIFFKIHYQNFSMKKEKNLTPANCSSVNHALLKNCGE